MADKNKKFAKASYNQQMKMLKEADEGSRIYMLHQISPQVADRLAKAIGWEQGWNLNKGNVGKKHGTKPFKGSSANTVNVATATPEASNFMNKAIRPEMQTQFEDLLSKLQNPQPAPMNQRLEEMFGHLQNPILQGLMNPSQGYEARGSMFPSEIENEYMQSPGHFQSPQYQQQNPFGNLLSALGQHGMQQHVTPWLNSLTPQDVQQAYGSYVEPGLNRAYEGAGNAYQGLNNAYGSARDFGQDFYGFAKTLPGEAYNDMGSLLSKLGSYLPGMSQ